MLTGFQKNLYYNGLLIKDLHPQTEEMCMVAVKQNGMALEFIDEQTEDIIMAAVKQNGLALKFAEFQSPEICEAAYEQTKDAFLYIRSRKVREKIEEKNKTQILHPDMEFDDVIEMLGKTKTTKPPSGGFDQMAPQKSR